jgi:hypothetical protein
VQEAQGVSSSRFSLASPFEALFWGPPEKSPSAPWQTEARSAFMADANDPAPPPWRMQMTPRQEISRRAEKIVKQIAVIDEKADIIKPSESEKPRDSRKPAGFLPQVVPAC